jgi:hypothetical protein
VVEKCLHAREAEFLWLGCKKKCQQALSSETYRHQRLLSFPDPFRVMMQVS